MYHRSFFTDQYHLPSLGRVRPDLRTQGLLDWESLPVEPGHVWRSVGPAGIHQNGIARVDAGLVSSIAVGSDPRHLTIGTRAGGVWGSADEGATWTPLGDRLPALQTMAVARHDSVGLAPLLLAGTGDANEAGARDPGLVGVLRSIDGGQTWALLDAGLGGTHFRSHDVNNVVALDRERMLVATRVGLYFSKDGGRNFGDDADHRNGRPVLVGHVTDVVIDGSQVAVAVAGDPPDTEDPRPPELFAQVAAPRVPPGLYLANLVAGGISAFGGAARLTNAAGPDVPSKTVLGHNGVFWMMSASKLDALSHSFGVARPSTLHSIHLTRRDPVTPAGWGTLSNAELTGLDAFQTTYCHVATIESSPAAASFNGWFGSVPLQRIHADVGSGSWTMTTTERGTPFAVHGDVHAVRVDDLPGPVRRILVGNDGGLTVSRDTGSTWSSLNSHVSCLLWSIAFTRVSPTRARLICGVQDNGTVLGEGPFEPTAPGDWSWHRAGGGDGGATVFIPPDAAHFVGDDAQAAFTTVNGVLQRAQPAPPGSFWTAVTEPGGETSPEGFIYSETLALGRDALGDWTRTYFGNSHERNGPGILRRRDGDPANAFNTLSPPAPYPAGPHGEFSAMITAIANAPADAAADRASAGPWDHLWVGLANGEVWFRDESTNTFSQMSVRPGSFPVAAIAVDPDNSQRVVVAYAGFTEAPINGPAGHVYLTENGGATWTDISGTRGANGFVPDLPVLSACFTRTDPPALLIGTDIGVLITHGPRLGERWSRLGPNLPKSPCSQLTLLNDLSAATPPALALGLPPVALATFGRGAHLLVRPAAAEAVIELDGGFGAMLVGELRRRSLTLHNVGNAPLSVGAPVVAAPFSLSGLPGADIPARSQVELVVECQPTAAGPFVASFTLAGATVFVSCEAFSDGPARLAIHPRQINFGDVPDGQTATELIHLKNLGQSSLVISSVTPVGAPSAVFELAASLTLAPGEEQTVPLRFRGAGVGTDHTGSWQLVSNDPIVDSSHFQINALGRVTAAVAPPPPSPGSGGLPGWVPWAIAGGVVVIVGAGVATYFATKHEDEDEAQP